MDNCMKDLEILWDEKTIEKNIKLIAKEIDTKWQNEPIVNLIPVLTGGIVFGTKLMIELESLNPQKWLVNPIIASAYEYSYNPDKPEVIHVSDYETKFTKGTPSILIDDLLDTGITLSMVKNIIHAITESTVEVAVLVDKVAKRSTDISPDYTCFTLENDHWLVGYGMDDKGLMRGLNNIGYLVNTPAEFDESLNQLAD
ncbi:MAG: hypothetical protein CMP22_05645 [Rickettsiales bacterium]|nr:hypothetical protein [Rickettsiales bacterium]